MNPESRLLPSHLLRHNLSIHALLIIVPIALHIHPLSIPHIRIHHRMIPMLPLILILPLDLIPHMRNLLVDTGSDTLHAGGFGERDASAVFGEVSGAAGRTFQAATSDHDGDGAFLGTYKSIVR